MIHITDDSRQVGQNSLFLVTPQNQKFLANLPQSTQILQREDLKQYYKTDIKIIGITGTNGKTTTAAIIYSIFLDMGYKVALLGTRGMFANDKQIKPKGLTTPSLLELYRDIDMAVNLGCEYFVMEVSSHAIKQDRIYGLDFFMKILTNITSDHLDYHKTWEDYAQTKLSFLQQGECIKIINADDKSGAKLRFFPNTFLYGIESKIHFFTNAYSLSDGIFAQVSLRLPRDTHEEVEIKKDSSNEMVLQDATLQSCLYGLFNLYNIMAGVLATTIATQKPLQEVCDLLQHFGGVAGRMEIVSVEPLIIVDFAHTHDGMQQVFESFKTKQISVVFGAGGDRDKLKRPKMGNCAATYASKIYITNDNPRSENPSNIAQEILLGIQESRQGHILLENDSIESRESTSKVIKVILDRREAIHTAIQELPKNWVLLILGKGDECVQIFKDRQIHFDDKACVQEFL